MGNQSMTPTGFVRVLENLESRGILFLAFQAWKVMEFYVELWKVMENIITLKNYESILIVYHDRQKFR